MKRITPSGPVGGTVRLPGSKSITNRALVVAALASGTSRLHRALRADDTTAMIESLNRLGVSVSWEGEDLVVDVYLDSRRRLSAGTRKGAEITVKDVSVLSIGEALAGGAGAEEFSYPCTWVVTASIRHWQHVHDRQNVYGGVLTLRIDEDRWKVVDLMLESEQRVVVPLRP